MKKTLLLGLSVGFAGLSFGQCEIVGLDATMCYGAPPVTLNYTAGPDIAADAVVYSGPGVSGGVFDPTAAGLGTHTVTAIAPGLDYIMDEGIPYDPIDIAGGGTVSLSDDAMSGFLPIGFDFAFFGEIYDEFQISSNGFITFDGSTDNGCCSGDFIPSGGTPNNLIALCWEDLRPPSGGTIRYETVGTAPNRICVVEFESVHHYFSGFPITGRIQMYETTNCIEIHLQNQDATGNHTMGIENATGTTAYAPVGKNSAPWTTSNFAVSFCPPPGCEAEFEIEVVEAPNVSGSVDVEEICLGEEITLTATGTADVYYWGAEIEDGVPYVPTSIGENVFVVSGTDTESGCISSSLVNVYVHDIPNVYAGEDFSICEDMEFVLAGFGDEATYEWDGGVVDGEPMMQAAGSMTYTVTGTNAGGCEASSSITVEALEVPTGTGVVTMMTGVAYDGEIDFTPSGGTGGPYTFLWTNGATTEDITDLGVGTFTVTVSDGVCDSDVTFVVDSQAGIALNELDNLKVYPNPVVDFVTVEFEGTYNWTLVDNAGKIVATGIANGKEQISMENLATGNYMMKVEVDGKQSTINVVKK